MKINLRNAETLRSPWLEEEKRIRGKKKEILIHFCFTFDTRRTLSLSVASWQRRCPPKFRT